MTALSALALPSPPSLREIAGQRALAALREGIRQAEERKPKPRRRSPRRESEAERFRRVLAQAERCASLDRQLADARLNLELAESCARRSPGSPREMDERSTFFRILAACSQLSTVDVEEHARLVTSVVVGARAQRTLTPWPSRKTTAALGSSLDGKSAEGSRGGHYDRSVC